jgi:tetratricopeptide (TPR) repeat protein
VWNHHVKPTTAKEPALATGRPRALWAVFVAAGLLTLLVFLPSLRNGFVRWDDDFNFLENESYRGLGASNLRWMLTRFHLGHYHPLTWLTLGLDWVLWGMNPLGYHLTNAVLHALGAFLLARLLARLLQDGGVSGRPLVADPAAAAWCGALAALVWSVHPLRVEAVTWITQRREVLCGVLTLLALTSHVRGRSRWLTAALALLAMLAKVTAVTIPALLVLWDVWKAGGIGAPGSLRVAARACARNAPVIAMAAVFVAVAFFAQREAGALVTAAALPPTSRLALYFFGIVFCLAKTVWPSGLAPLHQGQTSTTTWELAPFVWWTALGGLVLVAAAAALAWRRRRETPAASCLLAAFLVLVAPAGGLGQSGPQIAAERYTYQPGWVLALAGAILVARYATTSRRRARKAAVAAALVVAILAAATVRQQRFWFDSESLWQREAEVYPDNPIGNYNLGLFYYKRRPPDHERSERHYRAAIASDPHYVDPRAGLGFLLRATGRNREALEVFEEILRRKPHPMPSNVLALGANLLWDAGRHDEAIAVYERLVAGDPRNPEGWRQLGKIQAAAGRPREAIATFERGIASAPDPAVFGELAWLLATHPDAGLRDGPRALALAEAMAPRERRGLRTVTLFAAAAAEAGAWDRGLAEVRAAMARLPESEAALRKLVADLEARRTVRAEPRFP